MRQVLLTAVVVAVVGTIARMALFRVPPPPERVYQGKRLSAWLNDYWIIAHGNSEEEALIAKTNHEVDVVVRKIGTHAIPTLFRMLEATDSPLRKLAMLADQHDWHHFEFASAPAFAQNIQAAMAFAALGADAQDALPKLIDIYNRRQDSADQELAALALGGIGPPASNAVPSLLRTVTNSGPFGVPYNSLRALGKIHAEPAKVVPVLATLLKNSDVNVRMQAISGLREYGGDARPAVPALVESLTDQVDYIRTNAAKTLKIIDPEAASKAGVK